MTTDDDLGEKTMKDYVEMLVEKGNNSLCTYRTRAQLNKVMTHTEHLA